MGGGEGGGYLGGGGEEGGMEGDGDCGGCDGAGGGEGDDGACGGGTEARMMSTLALDPNLLNPKVTRGRPAQIRITPAQVVQSSAVRLIAATALCCGCCCIVAGVSAIATSSDPIRTKARLDVVGGRSACLSR